MCDVTMEKGSIFEVSLTNQTPCSESHETDDVVVTACSISKYGLTVGTGPELYGCHRFW